MLCSVDETVVREQAVKSFVLLTESLSDNEMQNIFAPLLLKIGQNESFMCRVSCCSLIIPAYSRSGSIKEKLRKRFVDFCNEDSPMIRRAAASRIGKFASCIEKEFLISDLIPALKRLSSDEQDSIRVLCLESLIQIAQTLSKEDNQRHILSILISSSEDKSWKVRLGVAQNFADLSKSFGKEITDKDLVSKFGNLLKDGEADVRAASIKNLKNCTKIISPDKLATFIIPILVNMTQDSSPIVRSGLSDTIGEMSMALGKELTIQKLLHVLQELLKDENHEAKLNAVNSLLKVASVAGSETINGPVLIAMNNLTKDGQWRVRQVVFEASANLGKIFGKEFFIKNIEPIFFAYLSDTAAAVRESGILKVSELANEFKSDWIISSLIPKTLEIMNKEKIGYLFRIACLNSFYNASLFLSKEGVAANIVPILMKSAKDAIPNVRFSVAKIIKKMITKFDSQTLASKIKGIISELSNDPDKDVQYYAKLCQN